MASLYAAGLIAWLPTWKQMPSASAAWRAACSTGAASSTPTPNLAARLSLECADDTRRRTHSVRSVAATPLTEVAATIFSTSSTLSSENTRTPWV